MKKVFVSVFFILVLVVFTVQISAPASAYAVSTCPNWLFSIDGECLSDTANAVIVESPSSLPTYGSLDIDYDQVPGRWLLSIKINATPQQVLFGVFNFNKFRLEPVAVYADQRELVSPPLNEGQYFDGLYVFTKLICDRNGSSQPSLTLSIPSQTITLADGSVRERFARSTMLDVTNWEEATSTACIY